MIHLDTNYIIGSVTFSSPVRANIIALLRGGEEFSASAVAWSEFLNGPVMPSQVQDALNMVQGRIIPFGISEAERSAILFNLGGRKRGSQPDCFIAAAAICARARLATVNKDDFQAFIPAGLRMA